MTSNSLQNINDSVPDYCGPYCYCNEVYVPSVQGGRLVPVGQGFLFSPDLLVDQEGQGVQGGPTRKHK